MNLLRALFGDIGIQNITKATAVEMFLERTEADRKDTFGFDDAKIYNSILKFYEISVVMGNGGDPTKAVADYITETVDNDGLKKSL